MQLIYVDMCCNKTIWHNFNIRNEYLKKIVCQLFYNSYQIIHSYNAYHWINI